MVKSPNVRGFRGVLGVCGVRVFRFGDFWRLRTDFSEEREAGKSKICAHPPACAPAIDLRRDTSLFVIPRETPNI